MSPNQRNPFPREVKVGVLAALVASLCCVGPLLATLVGLSGIAAFLADPTYHPIFLGAGALVIGGYIINWRRRGMAACGTACEAPSWKQRVRVGVFLLGLFLLGYGLLTRVLTPWVYQIRETALTDGRANSGYPARSRLLSLQVAGMTCAGCAGTIQVALAALPGVVRAEIAYQERRGMICYLPGTITPTVVLQAVEKVGYRASFASDIVCATTTN